jgi:hypothetical protein
MHLTFFIFDEKLPFYEVLSLKLKALLKYKFKAKRFSK